jgi:FkbM family methyltransferase
LTRIALISPIPKKNTMGKAARKTNRYKTLIRTISNYPAYMWFKAFAGLDDEFTLRFRDGKAFTIDKRHLGPFKECFLDHVYLQHMDLTPFSRPGFTMVDIGANAGFFSLDFLFQYPKAVVHSFEPMIVCQDIIQGYQKDFPDFNWHLHPYGVWKDSGMLELFLSDEETYSSEAGIFRDDRNIRAKSISVPVKSLADTLREYSIDRIDLLKMDCEGSEYGILYNLAGSLLSRIDRIVMETHQGKVENENITAMAAFLKAQGYTLVMEGEYIWATRVG